GNGPDAVRSRRVAVSRLAQLVAQVTIQLFEREVEERNQAVLTGQAYGRAAGQIPPAAETPPVVLAQVATAPDAAGDHGGRYQPDPQAQDVGQGHGNGDRGRGAGMVAGRRLGDGGPEGRKDQPGGEADDRLAEPPAVTGGRSL